MHVDNLNSGAYTIGEALEFFMKCKEGLALGGFNMRKFQSNSKELENLVVQKLHWRDIKWRYNARFAVG